MQISNAIVGPIIGIKSSTADKNPNNTAQSICNNSNGIITQIPTPNMAANCATI